MRRFLLGRLAQAALTMLLMSVIVFALVRLAPSLAWAQKQCETYLGERDGTLVIFAETAAWSARLRYAILELQREIHAADPAVTAIEVRVLPRR